MKKFAFLLMLLLALGMSAAVADTCGDFVYHLTNLMNPAQSTAIIYDYTGNAPELAIPAELDGYEVTGIDFFAFTDCTSLISVTIPDSVTSIRAAAFQGCTSLTNINIPNSVTYIGPGAFSDCPSLTLRVGCTSYAKQYAIENGLKYTCGHDHSADVPGDANSDRKVDINDALAILEYCAGTGAAVNTFTADVDGSGNVDLRDALLIFQHEAGWDVKIQ